MTSRAAWRSMSTSSICRRFRRRVAASSSAEAALASAIRSALFAASPGFSGFGGAPLGFESGRGGFGSGGFPPGPRTGSALPEEPPAGGSPRTFPSSPAFGVQCSDRQ